MVLECSTTNLAASGGFNGAVPQLFAARAMEKRLAGPRWVGEEATRVSHRSLVDGHSPPHCAWLPGPPRGPEPTTPRAGAGTVV